MEKGYCKSGGVSALVFGQAIHEKQMAKKLNEVYSEIFLTEFQGTLPECFCSIRAFRGLAQSEESFELSLSSMWAYW